jgi:hypothetical protein
MIILYNSGGKIIAINDGEESEEDVKILDLLFFLYRWPHEFRAEHILEIMRADDKAEDEYKSAQEKVEEKPRKVFH